MSRNKFLIFSLAIFFFFNNFGNLFAQDNYYEIKADRVKYTDGNNTVIAEGNAHAFSSDGKNLFSDKIIYKKKSILSDLLETPDIQMGKIQLKQMNFFMILN